jgi:predicted HTH domain antitoxin
MAMKMAKEVSTETAFWKTKLQTIMNVGTWQTEEEILSEALDALLSSRPQLRRDVAMELYLGDKVTLSRAAEIAGMNLWQFRDHLRAQGIEILVPEETEEDLDAMIASIGKASM